jgi:hypothetical protein
LGVLDSRLFPDDNDLRMSHMADAYAFRSLWDLRIYTIKIWLYTGTATVVSILGTSIAEEVFNFSLFNWLMGF